MHNRFRLFISGLATGYLAIAINIAYTAASVPLALHYLGKEQFGLWALAQQIMGYLMLLDFGVSSAVSRFIADRKDDVNGGGYGSLLITGAIVFVIQGVLIAIVGVAFSFFAPALFAVPDHLAGDFTNVLIIITSLAGLSVALRGLGAPLWAFQRMDFSYMVGSLSLLANFAVLWAGFHLGWGVYSFALAGIPGIFLSPIIFFILCSKGGYYPSRGNWAKPEWSNFVRVFSFGKDVFFMTLGSQLVNASQIIILSRFAGLDAAATFAVGTKLYNMGQQFTGRIIESSAPGLTEMFVRGDTTRFSLRFSNIFSTTAFVATLGATGLIAVNTPFVSFWTAGTIRWNFPCDALLAVLLIATSLTRCLISAFGLAGNLRPIRHIYFVEGCVFIAVAIPTASHFGSVGLLLVSLLTHVTVTTLLALRASANILDSVKTMVLSGLTSVVVSSSVCVLSFLPTALSGHPITIFLKAPIMILLAATGGWFLILNTTLRSDLVTRARKVFANVFR